MKRVVSVHEVTQDVLRAELSNLIRYLLDLGHDKCQLVFGWHWGMDYPAGAPWTEMCVVLSDLVTEIQKPENAGLGEFGRDDVTISVPPLEWEFCFCHHMGIHLTFTPPSHVAEDFYARWSTAGLGVVERDCPSEP
jgi:hypothetical protein